MKPRLYCCLSILFVTVLYSFSYANTIPAIVPFPPITLNPNDIIQAQYAFNTHAMIFCFDNNLETIANIQWPYQGVISSSTLPTVLKINAIYEGAFADPSGMLVITNTANKSIVISCQFGF